MQVDIGLFDQMVLQRTKRDVCDVAVSGKCADAGSVVVRVESKGKALRGLAKSVIGKAAKGKFSARLKGVPVGGPYKVALSVGDESTVVKDVLVGDVWILAGQSNMEGSGERKDAAKPLNKVRAFIMTDEWKVAQDPIHNLWNAIDPVHGGLPDGLDTVVRGTGPGVAFGQELYRRTKVPQGLIACAHGGTAMAQWDSRLKRKGGHSLYGAMIRRFKKNGSRVAGVAWYQGESDAEGGFAEVYTKNMLRLVRSFRRDLSDPGLPFVMVQIGRIVSDDADAELWRSVQEQQRLLGEKVKRLAAVPTIDLTLADQIHISGKGQQILGRRMAEAMLVLKQGRKQGRLPIALKSVDVVMNRATQGADIVVKFANVEGSLKSDGRPMGFGVSGSTGPYDCFFNVDIEGSKVILHTRKEKLAFWDAQLYHGYELDPPCNIHDEAGRPIPVFGPIYMGEPRAITVLVPSMRVSRALPGAGKLSKVGAPNLKKLDMKSQESQLGFMNVNPVFGKSRNDQMLFFACRVKCSEPMKLTALFGYDGPSKLWIDGKLRHHDPNGKNPAFIDDKEIRFDAAKGEHEVIIALGSNKGLAWGIYLRFERRDVAKRLIGKPDAGYAMPELLG